MKDHVLKGTMLTLALLATTSCAQIQPQQTKSTPSAATSSAKSKQQIVDLLSRYQQAMRHADMSGISATLHDDVVTTFQGKLTARGKSAVLENYQSTFQEMDFSEIEYLVDDIDVSQDLAVLSTYHPAGSFVTHKKDHKRIMDHNSELFALKKVQGQWLIYRYMFNQTPEQAK